MKYRSHGDYLALVRVAREERHREIHDALLTEFAAVLERRETDFLILGKLTEESLAKALLKQPKILKPLLAACNMGKRALRKDLGLEIDTFRPRLDSDLAHGIAEYLLPNLPPTISLEALLLLDGYQFVDSAVRTVKGRWERPFLDGLKAAGFDVRKRMFECEGEEFELDIASPSDGAITLAVDVKMIGHPADKHKRGDEIVNKAVKFKAVYPKSTFVSLVYYPAEEDRANVESRLRQGTNDIDEVIFAGDDRESQARAIGRLVELLREA